MKTLEQMRAERLGRMSEKERTEYEVGYEEIDAGIRISQLFYDERMELGLTQAELAKRMHTTQAAIARIENGAVMPGTGMLERLARVAHKRVALV
ncbi:MULTISPECIES: helix-turn-helix domain-containing protein [unclassified Brevibacterium]|uniref:helix-turn-helix domain-containing protein n=1 Tax=unclassified Brevibacterium TaxID=2614124 RepID=UPI0010802DDE|nr:helix-turn-helix transcriptional regulator [Brevibacterium sp. S111]TGD11675.1 XRE family transcriptional regulator [Brevibacterium sp. S111]